LSLRERQSQGGSKQDARGSTSSRLQGSTLRDLGYAFGYKIALKIAVKIADAGVE